MSKTTIKSLEIAFKVLEDKMLVEKEALTREVEFLSRTIIDKDLKFIKKHVKKFVRTQHLGGVIYRFMGYAIGHSEMPSTESEYMFRKNEEHRAHGIIAKELFEHIDNYQVYDK